MALDPKPVARSAVETTHIVLPGNTNALGTIFGGTVMQWIDEIAAVAAIRHAAGTVVTAAVDALQFLQPIHLGELVVLRAQVERRASELWATPLSSQSSGALTSAVGATHLISIAPAETQVPSGAVVDLIPLSWGA